MTSIRLYPDARAFLGRTEQWLRSAEMQHAMALQSARFASTDDSHFQKPLYWATLEDQEGRILGCAFRTPPYRLGMTAVPLSAVAPLVESVAGIYATLSGVAGAEPSASAFADAWTALRGGSWVVQSRQRLLEHRALVPAGVAPPGMLRPATTDDIPVAHQWGNAFEHESRLAGLGGALCVQLIRDGRLYFWDDGGQRCMLGALRETRDAAAVGILYTPPPHRERGYATAAVDAFNRRLLERGVPHSYFCLDPSNVAADSICHRLGYALVQETVDIDFRFA